MCGADGIWEGRIPGDKKLNNTYGWTNYTHCFPPGIRDLLAILNSQSDFEAEVGIQLIIDVMH